MKGDRINMSYSVIRMQKIKMGGVRGIQNHDQRITESLTNPDINPEKSKLNENIHEEDDRTYHTRIKDRIDELKLPKVPRKDAVVMCEFIATSDKTYFDKMPPEEQKRFFKASYEFIADRYGKENIIHATVHYDEKTPHLHMGIVPVTKDNKLSCYHIFDKKELMSLQQDFNKHMNDRGFELEKGEKREEKRKHLNTQRFKAETMKEQINSLSKEANTLKNAINALESDFRRLEGVRVMVEEINAIHGKSVPFTKKMVAIDTNTLENLKDLGMRQHVLEDKIKRLEDENNSFRERNSKSIKQDLERYNRESKLVKENARLNTGLKYLSKFLEDLGLKDKANEYIREQQRKQVKSRDRSMEL